jgi:UDP-N-acetyl-D-glucosamine dehydrogenase
VFVLGVAYKPGVTDTRESPALDIMALLEDRGAAVTYHDPHVSQVAIGEHEYASRSLSPETLAAQDCVVLVTDHAAIDIAAAVEHAPLLFDTRNATAGVDADQVHRL